MFYKVIIYGISISFILAAAYYLYQLQYITSNKGARLRKLSLKQTIEKRKREMMESLLDEELEIQLKEAGNPLNLNSISFTLFRYGIFIAWSLLTFVNWFMVLGPIPSWDLIGVSVFYLVTTTGRKTPLGFLLNILTEHHQREKNRECFMLYSLLLNDLVIYRDSVVNVYALLNKYKPYFEKINPAISKTIYLWNQGADKALNAFAKDIGTKEAFDLAQILKGVESTSPMEAYTITKNRYEQFSSWRVENHRRKMKTRGVIGYTITFIPIVCIFFNIVILVIIEYLELMKFINQY